MVGGQRLLDDLYTRGRLTSDSALDDALDLFVRDHRGLHNVRHGGAWAGYRAELSRSPTERTSVACLCNPGSLNPSELADRVADVVLAGRLGNGATLTFTRDRRSCVTGFTIDAGRARDCGRADGMSTG